MGKRVGKSRVTVILLKFRRSLEGEVADSQGSGGQKGDGWSLVAAAKIRRRRTAFPGGGHCLCRWRSMAGEEQVAMCV